MSELRVHRCDEALLDAWEGWAQAHPGEVEAAMIRHLTRRVARAPDRVLVAFEAGEPRVVAVVVDTASSAGGSADLAVIGASRPVSAAVAGELLAAAEAVVLEGPLSTLDVGVGDAEDGWRDALTARGYSAAIQTFDMARPAGTAPTVPIPAGWTLRDVDPDAEIAAYHALVTEAFAEDPVSRVSPAATMRERLRAAAVRPCVLVEAGALVGFVDVLPDANGVGGVVNALGVRGDARGRGLGGALLAEGLRRLGGGPARLGVLASNAPALALYRGYGFAITQASTVYSRGLRPEGR